VYFLFIVLVYFRLLNFSFFSFMLCYHICWRNKVVHILLPFCAEIKLCNSTIIRYSQLMHQRIGLSAAIGVRYKWEINDIAKSDYNLRPIVQLTTQPVV